MNFIYETDALRVQQSHQWGRCSGVPAWQPVGFALETSDEILCSVNAGCRSFQGESCGRSTNPFCKLSPCTMPLSRIQIPTTFSPMVNVTEMLLSIHTIVCHVLSCVIINKIERNLEHSTSSLFTLWRVFYCFCRQTPATEPVGAPGTFTVLRFRQHTPPILE